MKLFATLSLVMALAFAGSARRAEDLTVATAPPVVVKTVPQAGAADVDPGLKSISVTFSKDMEDESWSWVKLSDESFPKLDGKPKYDKDKRTCVLPVKLEPGKSYAIWLNSDKFENFKDADGRSSVPYLLVFETKKKD
jgi:RNA polymerase sigma-70 factor (ECF subfamily)